LKVQLKKLKVKVELRKKATVAAVKGFAPVAVVVAIGSTPSAPDIPGIDSDNVTNNREVLSGAKDAGNKVVIIGGGSIGYETADFLAEKGKSAVLTLS
jgi:2-enoate reductase